MAGGICGDPLMQTASTPTPSNGTRNSCEIPTSFVSLVPLINSRRPEKAHLRRQSPYVHARLAFRHSFLPAWQVPNFGGERLTRDHPSQPLGRPWQLGSFRPTYAAATECPDPVADDASFSIAFYLILDVAVGGTNGWFPDGAGNKPWLNGAISADFSLFERARQRLTLSDRRSRRHAAFRSVTRQMVTDLASERRRPRNEGVRTLSTSQPARASL